MAAQHHLQSVPAQAPLVDHTDPDVVRALTYLRAVYARRLAVYGQQRTAVAVTDPSADSIPMQLTQFYDGLARGYRDAIEQINFVLDGDVR